MDHISGSKESALFQPWTISSGALKLHHFVSGPFALARLLSARNIRDSSQSRYFRKAGIVADK